VRGYRTALLAAPWVVVGLVSAQGTAPRSEGVYTTEQAGRGKDVYVNKCSECHDGGIMGPELWGSEFLTAWDGKNVRALFATVKDTMPADAPGNLSERDVLDVVAYILKENGLPSGALPLGTAVTLDATIGQRTK
jgi:mono/diheme cytochrome c family protein